MSVGGVGPDDQDDVGVFNAVKILRSRACAKGCFEPVSGRRMTHACAGIDIVIAKACPDKFLHKEGFFIGATARGDSTKGVAAIFRANPFQFGRGVGKSFVPFDFAPRIADRLADHGLQNAFLMLRIAPGKAALDAAMSTVGLAVFVRDHPHQLFAPHFGAEGAANAAIGAGRDNAAFGCADFDHFLFNQRRRRAGLHTSPARHAFRLEEIIAGETCRNL